MDAMNWFQNWNAYSSTYFTIFKHPTINLHIDELSVCLRSVIINPLIYIDGNLCSLSLRQLLHLHISNTEFNSNTLRNTVKLTRLQFYLNPFFKNIFESGEFDSKQSTSKKSTSLLVDHCLP